MGLRLYVGKECGSTSHRCSVRYASNRRCEECTWAANRLQGLGKRARHKATERKARQRARARSAAAMGALLVSPIGRLYAAVLATDQAPVSLSLYSTNS